MPRSFAVVTEAQNLIRNLVRIVDVQVVVVVVGWLPCFGLVQFRGFALVAFGWGRFVDKLTRRVPKQRRHHIRPIPLGA